MSYAGEAFDIEAATLLCPADYVNPTPDSRYHMAVIGAGPAGLICAIAAAGLGAKVALIERNRMGGDCLNVGCVPSKALLAYTHQHADATFDEAFAHLRKVRAEIAHHDSVARYSEEGVDVFLGEARFDANGELLVDGQPIPARRTVICTGARADFPPIAGLAEAGPLTNESIFDLTEAPGSLGILGAGPIGCELALVFARLGVEVHLFELAPRVLPGEIEDAGDCVASALRAAGVNLHLGSGVQSVAAASDARHLVTTSDDEAIEVEKILVALGRRPNTDDLNLEAAGVEVDQRGFVLTDNKLRTKNKKIYAAGDCTAALQFTHHADSQAQVVVQNVLFAPTAKTDGWHIPRCTYTQPEVASVGALPRDLDEQKVTYDEYEVRFGDLDRGKAEGDEEGFVRVWTEKGGDRVLGATIVGHDAGEQLAPLLLLMNQGLGLAKLRAGMLPYPTRAEYLKRLAGAYTRTKLSERIAALLKRWFALIG